MCYIANFRGNDFTMSVEEAFKKHQVVPDVVSAVPTKLINVNYRGGVEVST